MSINQIESKIKSLQGEIDRLIYGLYKPNNEVYYKKYIRIISAYKDAFN